MTVLSTLTDQNSSREAEDILQGWLYRIAAAIEDRNPNVFAACFVDDDCYWRDILGFSGEFRTFSGPDEIRSAFATFVPQAAPLNIRPAAYRAAPRRLKRSAKPVVEGFFDLDTSVGRVSAFVRLLVDDAEVGEPRALLLLSTLQELHGFEERIGERRPTGVEYSESFAGDNWLEKRTITTEYAEREPEVLIVGAGQAGLVLAARLGQIGVDALVIERHGRVGDNWRNRYHSLTLHNEVWANSLPYMPFPPNWPTFLPKDKLAGWLEAYADSMELNVWTGTEFSGADFDAGSGTWSVPLVREGRGRRVIRPKHLVLATGTVSGVPRRPNLPGLDSFAGEVLHSSEFSSGSAYAGRHAIVLGTGNSGHDVAQDLYSNGAAAVTIVQRSPTCVVSLVPSGTMVYALYSEGPAVEDVDLITASIPYPVLRSTYQWLTRKTCELDKDLLGRLEAVGFETAFEPDHTGFHMRYLRTGGGYYINVGCSDLIAEGKINLAHAREIDCFTPDGMRLTDGRLIPADLVVQATGYENQQEGIRRLLGDDVADAVGSIWGFDEQGFMNNMWRRTGQPGFWIMGGALNEVRLYSRFLAVQIKAELEGIMLAADPAVTSAPRVA